MKLKPEELEANGFVLLDSLEHRDIVPFIQTYLKKNTLFTYVYYLSNLLAVLLLILYAYLNYSSNNLSVSDIITKLSIGIVAAFLLIPVHEYIHALAYKSQGAPNTSYDANLRKFYFMAMADNFVANRKEFCIVALAPFVTISITLLLLLGFVSLSNSLLVIGTLLVHTAFCSGDFGLLCYFDFHTNKEVVTYDDKTKGLSYFFGK
jgi:hypothetical protein